MFYKQKKHTWHKLWSQNEGLKILQCSSKYENLLYVAFDSLNINEEERV